MDGQFFVKLGLGFVVGGTFVACATYAAERFGSDVGGIIGGFPSIAAVALLFLGLVDSPEAAAEATTVMPLVLSFNGLYGITYVLLAGRGLLVGMGGALAVWLSLSLATVLIGTSNLSVSLVVLVVVLVVSFQVMNRLGAHGRSSAKVTLTPSQLVSRAVFGGGIIALAAYLGKVGGPLVGGVLSVFPAVFTSTLIIAHRSKGVEFARALTRTLCLSGMVNVTIYVLAVRFLYPSLGLVLGTGGALAVSALSAYGTYLLMTPRGRYS